MEQGGLPTYFARNTLSINVLTPKRPTLLYACYNKLSLLTQLSCVLERVPSSHRDPLIRSVPMWEFVGFSVLLWGLIENESQQRRLVR